MPSRALRPCVQCSKPSKGGRCAAHPRKDTRANATERGYATPEWRRARAQYLARHPLCIDPFKRHGNLPPAATTVDHIIPKQPSDLAFWDEDNWQPLCTSCHSTKTTKQDGGYGHRRVS